MRLCRAGRHEPRDETLRVAVDGYDDTACVDLTVPEAGWTRDRPRGRKSQVCRSGLLIDCYWHARSPPFSYTAISLDHRSI